MLVFKVAVPTKVFESIEAIRVSGKTNMLDLTEVVRIAFEMNFADAAMWIENNRSRYFIGIIQGFRQVERGG